MEEPTRVFLLRHGRTAWNAESRIQGQLDVPLDDRGRWEAARLALALAGETLAAIYSSDLERARETARPLAQATGVALHTDAALRERAFGRFEGVTYAEIEARWPDEARRWRAREPDFGPGGGEPLRRFYQRSVGAVQRLAAAHPGQAIAVVAHGGVLDCLYRAAGRIELQAPRTWQLGNAAINRLLWTPQGLSLVGWNDNSHLEV
ncbi:MAG: histidine phosphatase family protein [Burkholderiales bacterium]|nr:phosphoglycerate mutase family protein [Burkholderiales bacterium]MDE1927904.1 histidine phosphatase family protein [Burkholderiales bacterium]MDE2161222.1 histidine phosphatase family protein [Burkholderiales bacterium]MDE2503698.1 histidine phosphatase family protein [Burkholderiales bacterium]